MNREKEIIKTSFIGIGTNILLVVGKIIIGIIVHSIAIVLDAVNNLTDVLSSVVTIVGTKLSNKKPDKKHPYGHGRIEYITSAIISIIILVAGILAIFESIQALIQNETATYDYVITIIIVSLAVLSKIALGSYFRYKGKKLQSDVLKASGKDALFDALLSFGTLVSVIVMMIWEVPIEGYIGIIIGIFILKGGFEILKESISSIIGRRANIEVIEGIKSIALSHKEVKGAYDLIINDYGFERGNGSIHIEVDDKMEAKDIHALTRKITGEIYQKYNIIITIGIYASNTFDEEISKIKDDLNKIILKYSNVKQLHGFYVDSDLNLISFDIIVDFEEKNVEGLKEQILKEIKEMHPQYNYYVVIDQDFSE